VTVKAFLRCFSWSRDFPAERGSLFAMQSWPMSRLPILVLAASLICAPARAQSPATGKAPESSPAPVPAEPALPVAPAVLPSAPGTPPTTAEPPRGTALGRGADQAHEFLERSMLRQVIGLDDFFGNPDSEDLHTSYFLRWRNSLRMQQGGGFNLGSTLRANIELSKINDRLQFSISGEDRPDQFTPSLPEDPGSPGFDRTFHSARIINTELRYQLIRSPATDFFLGAGADIMVPPQAFARARFQHSEKFGGLYRVNFSETLFVKTPYGFGETTELSFEQPLSPQTLVTWANSGTISQEIKALEWGSELSLWRELSPRSAATLTGGIYGNTSVADLVSDYRILLRYRRNFLRSWLFYELEPQITWQANPDHTLSANYAFTWRLEVVFRGEEKIAAVQR